jgi:hypothetical protein
VVIARRPLLGGYALWWVVLVVAYYGLPGLRTETWGLIGLSGVAAIVAGVALNRPAHRLPWLILAVGNLSFIAGQVSFLFFGLIKHEMLPFPSFADVLYLITYPLYAVALLIFIRARNPDRDRRSVIDALTPTEPRMSSWKARLRPVPGASSRASMARTSTSPSG